MTALADLGLVADVALWLLLLTNFVLVLLLYRHFGLMSLGTLEGVQRDGLPVGDPTPVVVGIRPDGVDTEWTPSSRRPSLLLFAAPDCGPCRDILPQVSALADAVPELELAVVTDGPVDRAKELADQISSERVTILAEDASGAFNNYRVRVTPFAFVIGQDGRVQAKGLCNDPLRVQQLLAAAGLESLARTSPRADGNLRREGAEV